MNSSIVRVINANNTYEDKQMTDKEIVEELLNGASLRTFMMPDILSNLSARLSRVP